MPGLSVGHGEKVEMGAPAGGVDQRGALLVLLDDRPARGLGPEAGLGLVIDDIEADRREGTAVAHLAQHAELVALGVGQHLPALVARLADVGPHGPGGQEALDRRGLVLG